MGTYNKKYHFPDSPYDTQGKDMYNITSKTESEERLNLLGVYDSNSIGQYLGGIDFDNIKKDIQNKYVNPTRGFINETATFKPNTAIYHQTLINNVQYNGKKYFIGQDIDNMYDLNVIHVHSKQLYLFSSIFDINYNDVITGDRIIQICDFVLTDYNQYIYNKNLIKHNPNIILIHNFNNINMELFNKHIKDIVIRNNLIKLNYLSL